MIDKRIKFDENYEDIENGTITLYFIAPKEMLSKFNIPEPPNTVSMEISVEFPIDHIEPRYGDCCISPTVDINGVLEDIDWRDIDLPYDEIEELISLGLVRSAD